MHSYKITKFEIATLIITTLLFLLRGVIPSFKYIFIVLFISLSIYYVIQRKITFLGISTFIKNYLIILFLFLYILFSIFLSNKLYLSSIKDILNVVILLILMFYLTIVINSKQFLEKFQLFFLNIILFFSFVISIVGILDSFNILSSELLVLVNKNDTLSQSKVFIDNNFALIPVFFGIIYCLLFKLDYKLPNYYKVIITLLFFIFSIRIILSGSVRGIILLISLFTLIGLSIFFLRKKVKLNLLKRISSFFIIQLLIILLMYIFTTHISYKTKYNLLNIIGSNKTTNAKLNISSAFYSYFRILDPKITYFKINQKIWSTTTNPLESNFIPSDPESGWGSREHKNVFPLTGKNSDILPKDAVGYLIDSVGWPVFSPTNWENYTLIFSRFCEKGEKIEASIYCYVSGDFNGDTVRFCTGTSALNNYAVSRYYMDYYDMSKKNSWQKLKININSNGGEIPIYASFFKNDMTNIPKMRGYIIFAYPEYSILKDPLNNDKITTIKISSKGQLNNLSILNFTLFKTIFLVNTSVDQDPIRNWIAKIVSEDTTYYPLKKIVKKEYSTKEFGEDRLSRWKFAIKIWLKEYNLPQKFFGDGFNFLNWYGYTFLNDKVATDYPHNPFLYILLYSGLVGLILYIYLLYKVFYIYIKYVREYYLMFIFFLITFFFTFFSGGNPFDPPIMGFFIMLPFLIHYIHKKDQEEEKVGCKS